MGEGEREGEATGWETEGMSGMGRRGAEGRKASPMPTYNCLEVLSNIGAGGYVEGQERVRSLSAQVIGFGVRDSTTRIFSVKKCPFSNIKKHIKNEKRLTAF